MIKKKFFFHFATEFFEEDWTNNLALGGVQFSGRESYLLYASVSYLVFCICFFNLSK